MPVSFPVGGVLHSLWGRQSCPQPPFRRLFRATGIFPPGKSRLKAGCSQDLAAPQFVQNGLRSKTSLPHHWAIQVWWALLDLNQRPTDYESAALTAELRARSDDLPQYRRSGEDRETSP